VLAATNQPTNQPQELKGNIRVFCRVRPMCPAAAAECGAEGQAAAASDGGVMAFEFPPVTDLLSAGVVLNVRTLVM
jgi:hypothetical protein